MQGPQDFSRCLCILSPAFSALSICSHVHFVLPILNISRRSEGNAHCLLLISSVVRPLYDYVNLLARRVVLKHLLKLLHTADAASVQFCDHVALLHSRLGCRPVLNDIHYYHARGDPIKL